MTKDKKMSNNVIIAPMATAIWLIDNTSLSFKQIGDFCGFTEAEVQLMADGVIGAGILPVDPTKNENLTDEEIFNREQDGKPLTNTFTALNDVDVVIRKKKKYIPMLQRRNRPDAVLWLVNYCSDLSDAQIIKLVRTTKNMVTAIRDRSYKAYNELVAKDPVVLGLCSQKDLDSEVAIARKKKQDLEKKSEAKIDDAKKPALIRKININNVKIYKVKTTKKTQKAKVGVDAKAASKNVKTIDKDTVSRGKKSSVKSGFKKTTKKIKKTIGEKK